MARPLMMNPSRTFVCELASFPDICRNPANDIPFGECRHAQIYHDQTWLKLCDCVQRIVSAYRGRPDVQRLFGPSPE
jgi:hypothetical protein